ncbi:MAG: ABC transporter ATP-binding protein [Bacilli bacterium]
MVRILKYLRSIDWLYLIIVIGFVTCGVWLDLKMPEYMKEITTLTQTGGSTSEILVQGGYMLACCLGSLACTVVISFLGAKIGSSLSRNLRTNMFAKVGDFSKDEINKFSIPSLITRSTNDITQIQTTIIMGIQVIIKAPILATWAIIKILGNNFTWSMITLVAVVLVLVCVTVIMSMVVPRFKRVQREIDDVNSIARENITGIRVIRAYNAEEHQEKKFSVVNDKLMHTQLANGHTFAFLFPYISFIMNSLTLIIYWVGAYLISNSEELIGKIDLFSDMIVFSSYAIQVIYAFVMLTMVFMILPRAQVSAKRLREVLNTKSSLKEGYLGFDTKEKGSIAFKNVSYRYPDAEEAVLNDISFEINKGETVAFVGSTGSGKSTLINLIPRFYDATSGKIIIDGKNIKDYKISALSDKIAFVPQKPIIFEGTIRSNVLYGKNESHEVKEEDFKKAIKYSCSEEFVLTKEGKYDAAVEQNGNNLSGGQKQRISIARALVRNPEIIIFDDSFSALDYRTDKTLRDNLNKYLKNTTKLIVAQRIGTIKDANKIIVLDEGRIVGIGTHRELLKSCKVYLEIAQSQFSEEEIQNELN